MQYRLRLLALAAFLCAFAPHVGAAQGESPAPSPAPFAPTTQAHTSITHHTIVLDGKPLAYTATAGVIQLKTASGDPDANVFYTAYTMGGDAHRPVTFLYNGGPGSSSMWLHIGAFGPRRVVTTDAKSTPPAPYAVVDNDGTLLDRSDLVFIDAVGTGYSKLVGHGTGSVFFGVDEDAQAFAQFIKRWVTLNDRWNAPKYLLGESYGTTRSAQLVNVLQNDGMAFTGVILVSSVLDFTTFDPSQDLSYIGFFPTEAATAWYHHRVPNPPASIVTFLADVRHFAAGEYAAALIQGANLPAAQRSAIVQKMHAYTGLDPRFIDDANLRVSPGRFEKELLRDERKTVGRLDSRFTGSDSDAAGEAPQFDPTDAAVSSAFVASFNNYVRNDLKFQDDDEYKGTNYSVVLRNWNYRRTSHGGTAATNVTDDLRQALTKNPNLRLFSANGYYDLATPFFATEYTLAHLGLEPSIQRHISYGFYQSGHMIYINTEARHELRHDLDAFYDDARR